MESAIWKSTDYPGGPVSLRDFSLAVGLLVAAAPVRAQEWRFCVGIAAAAHETVISDIFASAADSSRLERRLENYFRVRKARSMTFQCPRGAADRVAALNAQTAALQFNRVMGYAVNGLPASELSAATGEESF